MWQLTCDMWEEAKISQNCVNYRGGKHKGSTKLLYLLSEITETQISHRNFSLNIMHKIRKKNIFFRETIYCNTKTKNYFLHKFMSQKQVSFTETTFLWFSVRETHFCHIKKKFLHSKVFFCALKYSFWQRKKASS